MTLRGIKENVGARDSTDGIGIVSHLHPRSRARWMCLWPASTSVLSSTYHQFPDQWTHVTILQISWTTYWQSSPMMVHYAQLWSATTSVGEKKSPVPRKRRCSSSPSDWWTKRQGKANRNPVGWWSDSSLSKWTPNSDSTCDRSGRAVRTMCWTLTKWGTCSPSYLDTKISWGRHIFSDPIL